MLHSIALNINCPEQSARLGESVNMLHLYSLFRPYRKNPIISRPDKITSDATHVKCNRATIQSYRLVEVEYSFLSPFLNVPVPSEKM